MWLLYVQWPQMYFLRRYLRFFADVRQWPVQRYTIAGHQVKPVDPIEFLHLWRQVRRYHDRSPIMAFLRFWVEHVSIEQLYERKKSHHVQATQLNRRKNRMRILKKKKRRGKRKIRFFHKKESQYINPFMLKDYSQKETIVTANGSFHRKITRTIYNVHNTYYIIIIYTYIYYIILYEFKKDVAS